MNTTRCLPALLVCACLLSLSPPSAAQDAAPQPGGDSAEQERIFREYAKCYSFYSIAHFLFGSMNMRDQVRFYLQRTELTYLHATLSAEQYGLNINSFVNTSLLHRNMMMQELGDHDGNVQVLLDNYQRLCEEMTSRIPAATLEHYERVKRDLREPPV
ncbi:MAG: hypothetical protein RLZZ385_287 [Pseudomonadota bacterium]|jgi:hypothetical protein